LADVVRKEPYHPIEVALLTGGADRPYAFGLASAILRTGALLDLIGNDELDCPEFRYAYGVKFHNLRGDQRPDVGCSVKALRVLKYYVKLIYYAAVSKPTLFHILWNNKFEFFDRTILMLWYRWLGKQIILTLHNVNGRRRDARDSALNRITLRFQYRQADHIFVHTEKMKLELMEEFGERDDRITVIPFGINNAVPDTELTSEEAKKRLGVQSWEKTILFFGHIAPYKGLEYLVTAFQQITGQEGDYRLIIAGRPKNCERYWRAIRTGIDESVRAGRVLLRDEFIPDEDTEVYMKAADVLVLPYRHIYQSGVLFLGYSFGLPVLAADVGSLRDEIIEGETGFVFNSEDPADLARVIDLYFASGLYGNLANRRSQIRDFAAAKHSWDVVAEMTMKVYADVMGHAHGRPTSQDRASAAADAKIN
jgi:D-inositol-3-phosphate glycosyltransferase